MINNEQTKKKFLVVGLGPIGSILSCHLKMIGCSIYGIDVRADLVKAIQEQGIAIEGITSCRAKFDQVCTRIEEIKEKDFDYVMVAVKAPYLPDIVSMLSNLNNNFKIVVMQNGIDNEEYLARFFGNKRILRVIINYAGNITTPGHIKMTFFHKPNYVGCFCSPKTVCDHSRELADLISEAGLETEPTAEVKKMAWRKTILVAALAPVSAILGMTMAEVMTNGDARSIVVKLLREAIEVARLQNYNYGEEFFEYCLDYLSTAGHHKPSMLIDIENGLPTEIDYINGRIAFHGHQLNVPVLLNTSITSMIKAREQLEIKKRAGHCDCD
jgi:2-dehydropantoate 2-reductase